MFTNRPAMKKEYRSREESETVSPEGLEGIRDNLYFVRDSIQRRLLSEFEGEVNQENHEQLRQMIEVYFNQLLVEENLLYTRANRQRLLEWVISDIIGYGPLEPLLQDNEITEIMVNGPHKVYVERFGKLEETKVSFEDEPHLRRIIDRIVAPIGRRVDESSPMVDARLPSGYRVNATIPPLSLEGPLLTIRKFATIPYTAQDLIANGTLNAHLVSFLQACSQARINMVISGGTGSGKTTLLNLVSAFIPSTERVITIEDVAELKLNQAHVIRLEKRPPNIEGKGEVSIRQLVVNALRMRPDRIIVGEARSGEALDMLQAMNTGHSGSMTTIHSNSPRDTLRRIETMVLMAGVELPLRAIREQVASAIELVIHLDRMRDGTRKVTHVTEVQGMEGDTIVLQDIFIFDQTGFKNGRVVGKLRSTGLRPSFAHRFEVNNIILPENIYDTEN
ncbi:MAG: CpaF family protein [Anaerolineales bacterium]